jgi:hypothetical protein
MRTFTNASFKEWQALPPFSLTPALSRGEQASCAPAFRKTERGVCRTITEKERTIQLLLPLPQGEGQGEGESYTTCSAKFISKRP